MRLLPWVAAPDARKAGAVRRWASGRCRLNGFEPAQAPVGRSAAVSTIPKNMFPKKGVGSPIPLYEGEE